MSISWWQTPCWLWRYHSEGKKPGPSMLTEDQGLPTLGHDRGPSPGLGSNHSLRARWPARPTGGWDLLWASPFSKGLSSLLSPPEAGNTSHSSKAVTLESPQPFLILLLPPQPIFLPSSWFNPVLGNPWHSQTQREGLYFHRWYRLPIKPIL